LFRFFAGALLAMVIGMASPAQAKDKDYTGTDGGYAVYAVGTIAIGTHFDFFYNRTLTSDGQAVSDWKGRIEPTVGGAFLLKVKNPDFSGVETGHVVIRRLPPGKYEVNTFAFYGSNLAGTDYSWKPKQPFSLPFEVRTGEATYIGSFMRAPSLGTPLQPILGAAGYFLIADRRDRDLPIAMQKLPGGTRITTQVTDVAQFDSAALRTAQP
jgi:hypothetical protein